MDNFIWGFIGLGIILALAAFLAFFGGVEKEDPYATHHSIKKSSQSKR